MSMITATSWVRRGVAAPFPVKYEIDEDEINRISELAKLQLQDAKTDLKEARDGDKMDEDEDVKEKEERSGKGSGKGAEKRWVVRFCDLLCLERWLLIDGLWSVLVVIRLMRMTT